MENSSFQEDQNNDNSKYQELLSLRIKLEDKEKELVKLEKEKEELEAQKKEVRQSLIDSAEIKMT